MRDTLGKYIRHLLASFAAAFAVWAVENVTLLHSVDTETVREIALAVMMFVAFVVYSYTEKVLKRLSWLDPEGYRDWIAHQAPSRGIPATVIAMRGGPSGDYAGNPSPGDRSEPNEPSS